MFGANPILVTGFLFELPLFSVFSIITEILDRIYATVVIAAVIIEFRIQHNFSLKYLPNSDQSAANIESYCGIDRGDSMISKFRVLLAAGGRRLCDIDRV